MHNDLRARRQARSSLAEWRRRGTRRTPGHFHPLQPRHLRHPVRARRRPPADPGPRLPARGRAARPGLPDPAGGRRRGGRLHLGADARPGPAHGGAPAVAGAAAGRQVAMLAKNSAHFFMAELAIWMAGGTTVAIFPTETADNVGYVLSTAKPACCSSASSTPGTCRKAASRPACPASPCRWRAAMADRLRHLGRHRRAHAAPARPAAARRRRSGDAALHLGLDRPAQGRDADLRQHHRGRHRHGRPGRGGQRRVREPSRVCPTCRWRIVSSAPGSSAPPSSAGDTHVFFSESLATFMADMKRAQPTCFISVPRLWTKFQQACWRRCRPPSWTPRWPTRRWRPWSARRCWPGWGWTRCAAPAAGRRRCRPT
jgi:hypothetical protein